MSEEDEPKYYDYYSILFLAMQLATIELRLNCVKNYRNGVTHVNGLAVANRSNFQSKYKLLDK